MKSELNVVLVRSMYPSNIGAAARALANMGGDRIILLDPKCHVNAKSRQGAAGAQFKLSERVEYASWEEFYSAEGEGLRLAFTKREGKQRKVLPLPQLLEETLNSHPEVLHQRKYLIFGPEDDGLSADDMAFVNASVSLPTFGDFKSLNLAQAVLLGLYITQNFFETKAAELQKVDAPIVEQSSFYFPDESIKEWLTAMGFDIDKRKASAYLTLRRLFLQNHPTQHELQVLEAVLQQNIRKLKEINSSEASN